MQRRLPVYTDVQISFFFLFMLLFLFAINCLFIYCTFIFVHLFIKSLINVCIESCIYIFILDSQKTGKVWIILTCGPNNVDMWTCVLFYLFSVHKSLETWEKKWLAKSLEWINSCLFIQYRSPADFVDLITDEEIISL